MDSPCSAGGTVGAESLAATGVIFRLVGGNMLFRDFTVDTYAGGQAFLFAGDDIEFDGVTVRNSAQTVGTGGIRCNGGARLRVHDCDVSSGDDCFILFPPPNPASDFAGFDITDAIFSDCVGYSGLGRLVLALLIDESTTNITNCEFRQVNGSTGNAKNSCPAVFSTNQTFTDDGVISGIRVVDCTWVSGVHEQAQDILISECSDVTFTRLDLTAHTDWYRIHSSTGVDFDDCTFTGGVDPNARETSSMG